MDTNDALAEHLGINGSEEKCSLKSGKRNSRPKAI
jgi:hypothetical protein